jgi:hypothetical protein
MSFLKRLTSRKTSNKIQSGFQSVHRSPEALQPQQSVASRTMDAPPAYSAAPVQTSKPSTTSQQPTDSPYAFLSQFDTVFVIDDSGSMAGRNWRETAEALSAITPICTQQDADGVDIFFLNGRNPYGDDKLGGFSNVTIPANVEEIFRTVKPRGSTPTGTRLNAILKQYLTDLTKAMKDEARGREHNLKPLNIIVITDGAASDDVESVIVSAAKKLDTLGAEPWQVGIQFFQVGNDQNAAADLKELDDALSEQHGVRDMVDTVPWNGINETVLTADSVMKVTMGAINRKLDRKKAGGQ